MFRPTRPLAKQSVNKNTTDGNATTNASAGKINASTNYTSNGKCADQRVRRQIKVSKKIAQRTEKCSDQRVR